MIWEARNNPDTTARVVAGRFFDVSVTNELSIARSGENVSLTWLGNGVLQCVPSEFGPYCDIGGASPEVLAIAGRERYCRLRAP